MKTKFLFILISLFFCSSSLAESRISEENLLNAYEIPNSRSPNEQYGLYLINMGLTTGTIVGFMPVTKQRLLGESSIWGQGLNPDLYKKYVTILWSSDSKYVALHDSHSLHSNVHVYRILDHEAEEIFTPNIIEYISKDKPDILKAISSGQIPTKWNDKGTLEIDVRYKNSDGLLNNFPLKLKVIE